jgi:hypothetical protein
LKGSGTPKNVLAAFAVAPLGGAGLMAAIAFLAVFLRDGDGIGAGIVAAVLLVLISLLGYAIAIMVGIPGYLLFRRLGWVRRPHWIALGAVLGATVAAIWPIRVLLINPNVDYGIAALAAITVAGLVWGATSGLAFGWVIKIN